MKLIQDFGIRALLALILVVAVVVFVGVSMHTGKNIPEAFMGLVSFAVGYYFGNRSTLDKPE